MARRETLKDWRGKVIGFIDHEANGNKILRNYQGVILGKYDKSCDVTREFSGRQVAKGDCLMMLLK